MKVNTRIGGVWSRSRWAAGLSMLVIVSTAATSQSFADQGGGFVAVPVENPRYCGNELFRAFEDYDSPRVRLLRKKYNLDAVVADETDEWKRILLLRHWIKSTIAIENANPTKTRGDTFAILDAARNGGKFHCAHFSIVQHAVLNSFGYVTRRLGCGPGRKNDGGNHGVNEVWVNKFSKWVLIDAKYDVHFEKDQIPLSALEIRDEVWRDGAQSVVRVAGPDRRPMTPDPDTGQWETRPDTYRWCSWETDTNRFTTFPAKPTSTIVMLADERFKSDVWYRDGKPHWSYGTPFMILTTRRTWIEWTPNVITSKVTIDNGKKPSGNNFPQHVPLSQGGPQGVRENVPLSQGGPQGVRENVPLSQGGPQGVRENVVSYFRTVPKGSDGNARVFLSSCTPNFRSFQVAGGDGVWNDCGEQVKLDLVRQGRNEFTFRTMNLFGVAGPKHRIEIVFSQKP